MDIRLQLFDALFAIDTPDKDLSKILRLLWKPFETDSRQEPVETFFAEPSDGAWFLTWNDGKNRVKHLDIWSLMDSLRYVMLDIERGDGRGSPRIHAGAVELAGKVVLLPGEGGTGKTTLTLALSGEGWTYLSDDLIALDLATNEIVPLPKPLSIKDPHSWETHRHLFKGVGELSPPAAGYLVPPLGVKFPMGPVRPNFVIFPSFEEDAPLTVEGLSQGETAALISRYVTPLDARAMKSLSFLVAGCVRFRMSFGRSEDAVEWINQTTKR